MATSTYSLLQIRTDLIRIAKPSDNDTWLPQEYDRRIHAAIREIASTHEIPELENISQDISLATGIRSYSLDVLDPNLFELDSVQIVGKDNNLDLITKDQAINFDSDEQGEPREYFVWGNSLEVYPLPSSSFNGVSLVIRYISEPTVPISDSAVSPLPADFDRTILQYAAFLTLTDRDESTRAGFYLNGYLAQKRSRKSRRAREFVRARTSISTSR